MYRIYRSVGLASAFPHQQVFYGICIVDNWHVFWITHYYLVSANMCVCVCMLVYYLCVSLHSLFPFINVCLAIHF